MTTVSSATNGTYFLQSLKTTGNWMLDATSTDTSDWMDPTSNGPDSVGLAANAFAKASLLKTSYSGTLAINQGILTLQSQLNSQVGSKVNIFA